MAIRDMLILANGRRVRRGRWSEAERTRSPERDSPKNSRVQFQPLVKARPVVKKEFLALLHLLLGDESHTRHAFVGYGLLTAQIGFRVRMVQEARPVSMRWILCINIEEPAWHVEWRGSFVHGSQALAISGLSGISPGRQGTRTDRKDVLTSHADTSGTSCSTPFEMPLGIRVRNLALDSVACFIVA